jgi:uroporphyrinogen-III decarboxylase
MYQVPDKLLAAIDMITPLKISGAVMMAKQAQVDSAVIFLHRGSEGFMSDAQFARFYWPCLRDLILGLIDAGIRPIVYTEGDYTPRLKYFQDLPAKKFVMHYQDVDRKLAKKLLGDICCFWGNVPSALMCTGTPEQVKDDVKELIDIFGDNGGLVIDSTIGIPDESKPENVQALTDAVHEYGMY